MKRLLLAKCVGKRYKRMEIAFKEVAKDFDEAAIHSFRMEVKKIGSLVRLANGLRRKSSRPLTLHKLDVFYKKIGVVRSLQLQVARVKGLDKVMYPALPPAYLLFLQRSANAKKKSLEKALTKKKPFEAEKKKLLRKLTSKPGRKAIQKFVDERIALLKRLLQVASPSDESLHALRKILKDILVIASETKLFERITSKESFDMKRIKELTTYLGEFHDQCINLDLLHQHYTEQSISEVERMAWIGLYTDWWNEKERCRITLQSIFQKICPHRLASTLLLDNHRTELLSK